MTKKNDTSATDKAMQYEPVLCTVLSYLKTTRRAHYECEDSWYNCNAHPTDPGHDQGYDEGECSCGADDYNKELDKHIKLIEDALNGA